MSGTPAYQPTEIDLSQIHLSEVDFWLQPRDFRENAFHTLRERAPVHFFDEMEFPPFPTGPGYFALTRHDDIWHVSRNP